MDTQGRHFRRHLKLNQAYVDALPLEAVQGGQLTFVADTVELAGASFSGFDVQIYAREVSGTGITLRQPVRGANSVLKTDPSPFESPYTEPGAGPEGHQLTILCLNLAATGSVSVGGMGGRGTPGASFQDLGPPDPDPDGPLPHDPVPKPPPLRNHGLPGTPGGQGGPGGRLVVRCVESTATGFAWERRGGRGGPAGPRGRCREDDGHPHANGASGPTPLPVFVTPSFIDQAQWLTAVRAHPDGLLGLVLALRHTVTLAKAKADFATAADARTRLRALSPGDPPDFAINYATSDLPVERSGELVPAVEHYVEITRGWRNMLKEALSENGGPPTLVTAPGMLGELAKRLTSLLDLLDQNFATRELVISAAVDQRDAAVGARDRAVSTMETMVTLAAASPATVTVGGSTVPVGQVAVALRALRTTAVALPAAPHLLASAAVRDAERGFSGKRLADFAASAAGLADLSTWASILGTRAVNLPAVRAGLRGAPTSDPAARTVLVRLADAVQTVLLAELRIRQADQTLAKSEERQQRIVAAKNQLAAVEKDDGSGLAARQGRLLAPLSTILAFIGYHAQQERRAIELYTLGTVGPMDEDDAVGQVSDPDLAADADELGIPPFTHASSTPPTDVSLVVAQFAERDRRGVVVKAYESRGHDLSPNPHPETITFGRVGEGSDATDTPELAAFKQSQEVWFDVGLGDLTGTGGEAIHREAKVLGVSVRVENVSRIDETLPLFGTVVVTHEGVSRQLMLGAQAVPVDQVLLPAGVPVDLVPENFTGQVTSMTGSKRVLKKPTGDEVGVEPIQFPAHGRGAAAGWSLRVLNSGSCNFTTATAVAVTIEYGAVVPEGLPTLRGVRTAAALTAPGQSTTATAELTAPAGRGGFRIDLASSSPAVVVPASVTVPAGQTSVAFPVEVTATARSVRLTATGQDGMGRGTYVEAAAPGPGATATAAIGGAGDTVRCVAVRAPRPAADGAPARPAAVLAGVQAPRVDDKPSPEGRLVLVNPQVSLAPAASVVIGAEPRTVVVDAGRDVGYILVGPGVVKQFRCGTLQVTATAELGFGVVDLALDAGRGWLYAVNHSKGTLHVLDTALQTVSQLTDERLRGAPAVACNPDTGSVYVIGADRSGSTATNGRLLHLRPDATGALTVVGEPADLGPATLVPFDLAVDPATGKVLVARTGKAGLAPPAVSVHAATGELELVVPLPAAARAVSVVPGALAAVVATDAGLVHVDLLTGQRSAPAEPEPMALLCVAVDPASGTAYSGGRRTPKLLRAAHPLRQPALEWR